jgi:hypothetical protein
MRPMFKKIIIYSMVGMLQCGLGAAVLEASPRHDEPQRYENNHRDRQDRRQEENDRYEREMQRRHHESQREWHERQRHENDRHEQVIRDIEGIALIYLLLNH